MATYTRAYYPEQPQHKYNKQVSILEQFIDYGGDYPARQSVNVEGRVTDYETGIPYANADVIEAIGLRANTTVLGVEVEVLEAGLSHTIIQVGDGTETDRWGYFDLSSTGIKQPIDDVGSLTGAYGNSANFRPYTYISADTIDVNAFQGNHGRISLFTEATPGGPDIHGANLVTTPAFGAATGWTVAGAWSIAAGVATRTANAANLSCTSNVLMTAGRYYGAIWDLATRSAGAFSITNDVDSNSYAAAKTNIKTISRPTAATYWAIVANATAAGTVDNAYVYLLTQNTARFLIRVYVLENYKARKFK
jgi:hypothetical protein